MRWLILTVGLWCAASAPGLAAERAPGEVSIAAFYGRWVGSGLSASGLSQAFHLTQRDFDVDIQPDGDGFRLTWTTVKRQKGDPANPVVTRGQAVVTFRPAGGRNLWHGADNADPLTGKPYAWARLERQSLVVTTLEIAADGKWEMQIYRRSLSDLGMKLDYTRLSDGEPARNAQGRLTKFQAR
jgi:hypothetical protein